MKYVLIEIQQAGKIGYLAGTSCLDPNSFTLDASKAINYADDEQKLEKALSTLVVPGDAMYAKSGVQCDTLPMVVEFHIQPKEISRRVGRLPHKY